MDVVASLSQGRKAAAQCGLFTYKSVPVIFESPCKYTWIKYVLKLIQTKLHICWVASLFCHIVHARHSLCTDVSVNVTHIDSFRNYIVIANNARMTVNAALQTDNPDISACTNISRVVWNHDLEYVVDCDRRSLK